MSIFRNQIDNQSLLISTDEVAIFLNCLAIQSFFAVSKICTDGKPKI